MIIKRGLARRAESIDPYVLERSIWHLSHDDRPNVFYGEFVSLESLHCSDMEESIEYMPLLSMSSHDHAMQVY